MSKNFCPVAQCKMELFGNVWLLCALYGIPTIAHRISSTVEWVYSWGHLDNSDLLKTLLAMLPEQMLAILY